MVDGLEINCDVRLFMKEGFGLLLNVAVKGFGWIIVGWPTLDFWLNKRAEDWEMSAQMGLKEMLGVGAVERFGGRLKSCVCMVRL